MVYKGVVLKIKNAYAIVLTDSNDYLKITKKGDLFVGQRIMFNAEDIFVRHTNITGRSYKMKKGMIGIVACLAVVLLIGLALPNNTLFNGLSNRDAYAAVIVDINPSIKLMVDENDKVVNIKAMNDEAKDLLNKEITVTVDAVSKTMKLKDYLISGIGVDDAVREIIIQAKAAGYIDDADVTEDYVLVTTVSLLDDDQAADTLKEQIKASLKEDADLADLKVAMIKATQVAMREAEGKKVPLGLYVVKGQIDIDSNGVTDGAYTSVKQFFASEENRALFKNKGEIVEQTDQNKVELAKKLIAKIEAADPGNSALAELKNRLNKIIAGDVNAEDIDAVIADIKDLWSTIEQEQEQLQDQQGSGANADKGNGVVNPDKENKGNTPGDKGKPESR